MNINGDSIRVQQYDAAKKLEEIYRERDRQEAEFVERLTEMNNYELADRLRTVENVLYGFDSHVIEEAAKRLGK